MNDTEVEKQIEQMVKFIKQEAREKADEIGVLADEEFNLEKAQTLKIEKDKIKKDYERKEQQLDVAKKIEYSKLLNEQRLRLLAARQDAIKEVIASTKGKLSDITSDQATYKELITDLIVQGVRKLQEPKVLVKCRESDKNLVQSCLGSAQSKYTSSFGEKCPELTLNTEDYLPPPPSADDDEDSLSCCGGIQLSSVDGRILCTNTLDERLEIAFQNNLPMIRAQLFGFDS